MTTKQRTDNRTGQDQHDRFKALARELGCSEDEAAFDTAVKKLAESKPLPKHEPKKRQPRGGT